MIRQLIASIAILALASCGGPGAGTGGGVASAPGVRPPLTPPGPPPKPSPNLPTKNILYANGQRLDLYIPKKSIRRTAIIFVHGGGFTSGNKRDLAGHAKLLSDGGFVTATINYRLAPKSPAPAAVGDVTAALRWMKRGGGGRALKIDKVILLGYSAGGTLAMMAGLKHKNEVAAVISAAGVSDLAALSRTTNLAKLKQDIAAYTKNTGAAAASPINQALRGAPPMFLIHGKKDKFVPVAQSVAMAQKLKAAKANILLKIALGVGHEVLLPNPKLGEILRDIAKYAAAVDGS